MMQARRIDISQFNLNIAVEQYLRSISAINDNEDVEMVAFDIKDRPYIMITKE